MSVYNIMSILVNNRFKTIDRVQNILTEYGYLIKVRLGLHDVSENNIKHGLILLQIEGEKEDIIDLKSKLSEIEGTDIQLITHNINNI